jgi:hypothetical protein
MYTENNNAIINIRFISIMHASPWLVLAIYRTYEMSGFNPVIVITDMERDTPIQTN